MVNIRAETQTAHLGRYHVVKRLAAGGMADVLLARTDGIEGFQRHVVIKRIHANLLEEPRYVKMFLDEARLAASLHHHNIVQVNDIGEEAGEYFFAMEYVHGEDARTLLVNAAKRDDKIPLEHVITIITAAAAGLHHAHDKRGADGSPLHIVHRDVSPANILVGYDGAVKVADFGIALAAHRAEQTQSGVLKGKVAYMSPEQCNCEPVDRRSDVFSLGIVLYELATIRPCFIGDNDFMTMSAIVNGKIERPSMFRPDLPHELEAIIMTALALRPEDRYQSADELRLALEHFAASAGLRTSTTALADYMKQQFGERALPWQEESDDPEIEMTRPESTQLRTTTPAPRSVTPAPVKRTITPPHLVPRERTPAPTVPLRPSAASPADLAVPAVPEEDDLSIPIEGSEPRAPTMPLRALPLRPPARTPLAPTPILVDATIGVDAPIVVDATVKTRVGPTRNRRLWLAGAIVAVAIAGLSLLVVSHSHERTPVPRTTAEPGRSKVAPQPLERPTVSKEALAPAARATEDDDDDEGAPARRKSRSRASKRDVKETREVKDKPAKKWDPDALFPD